MMGRKKGKLAAVVLAALTALALTGCVSSTEIGERKIVKSLALSQVSDGGLQAQLEIIQPEENTFLTVVGSDVHELVENLRYKEVFFDGIDQIFVQEQLLRQRGREVLRRFCIEEMDLRPGAKLYAYTGDFDQALTQITQQQSSRLGFCDLIDCAGEVCVLPVLNSSPLGLSTPQALRVQGDDVTLLEEDTYLGYLLLNRRLHDYKSRWGLVVSSLPTTDLTAGTPAVTVWTDTAQEIEAKPLEGAVAEYLQQCRRRGWPPLEGRDEQAISFELKVQKE